MNKFYILSTMVAKLTNKQKRKHNGRDKGKHTRKGKRIQRGGFLNLYKTTPEKNWLNGEWVKDIAVVMKKKPSLKVLNDARSAYIKSRFDPGVHQYLGDLKQQIDNNNLNAFQRSLKMCELTFSLLAGLRTLLQEHMKPTSTNDADFRVFSDELEALDLSNVPFGDHFLVFHL